jgi:hypothetical protein
MQTVSTMNRSEKEEFITGLCNSVRDGLLGDLDKVPEEWDGHELRELLSERFSDQRSMTQLDGWSARKKAYTMTVARRAL